MSTTGDCSKLKQFDVFSELTGSQCAMVFCCLEKISLSAKDTLVRQGSSLGGMYFVVYGRVMKEKICGLKAGTSGLDAWQEKELFEVKGPGKYFGEESLFDDTPCDGDWTCTEKTELFFLATESFKRIINTENGPGEKILQSLCKALSKTCRQKTKTILAGFEDKKNMNQLRIEKQKIRAMHRIARSTAESNVTRTLDLILEACIDCLGVEKGSVMIFDRGGLRVEAAFGSNKDKILGQRQPIDENTVSGRCFIRQEAIFLKDIEKEKGLSRSPDPSQYWNNSLICMPLISHSGESIGVLNVSKTSREIFTESDCAILKDLTLEASAALGHEISLARLYRQFQETFADVQEIQLKLDGIEEKIGSIMRTSWSFRDDERRMQDE
ncbi:MAG: GAF domain-containing protein [Desulfobulbaceae bacterium]|nr:GAF domain-containing protein [Desulfobulbaceae bacterium]